MTILVIPETRFLKHGPRIYEYVYVEIANGGNGEVTRIYCGSVNKPSAWDKAARIQREHYENRIAHYQQKISELEFEIACNFSKHYTMKNREMEVTN